MHEVSDISTFFFILEIQSCVKEKIIQWLGVCMEEFLR